MLAEPTAQQAEERSASDVKDTLGHSAQLRSDRNAEVLLDSAKDHIANRRFDAAVDALERVISTADPNCFLARPNGRYVPVWIQANQLLASVPEKHRERWEALSEPAIGALIRQASAAGDAVHLAAVSGRYESLAVGRDGLRTAAALFFDRGRFEEAATLYRRLAEGPFADAETRASAIAQLAAAWSRHGDLSHARSWFREHQEVIAAGTVRTEGRSVRLSEWLRANTPAVFEEELAQLAQRSLIDSAGPVLRRSQSKWKSSLVGVPELEDFVRDSLATWRSQGVSILGSPQPLSVGELLVTRSLDDLIAFNASNGDVVWKKSIGSLLAQIRDEPARLENDRTARLYSEAICERLLVDRVQGSVYADGECVFGIVETSAPDETEYSMRFGRRGGRDRLVRMATNRLVAWNAADGAEIWSSETGTEDQAAAEAVAERRVFFHGPVVPYGNSILCIANIDNEISLIALNAKTGKREWLTPLADVPRAPSTDRRHQRLRCPIAIADGTAVCCTSAGAIVAVDLATRTPKWAFRYERNDAPRMRLVAPGRWTPERRIGWWDGWQAETAVATGRSAFIATAESNHLRAFSLSDGHLLWERPREDGLYVAGVVSDRLVIVGTERITAVDCKHGNDIWTTSIDSPAGLGVFLGSSYILPTTSRNILEIRLTDGLASSTYAPLPEPLGNLIMHRGGMIAQTPERIVRMEGGNAERSDASSEPPTDDSSSLIEFAMAERDAGRFESAIQSLDALESDELTDESRKLLRGILILQVRHDPPTVSKLQQRIESLSQSPTETFEGRLAAANAFQKSGSPADAVDLYVRALKSLGSHRDADEYVFPSEVGSAERVRGDRFIRGQLLDLIAGAKPDQVAELLQRFEKHLKAAETGPDPHLYDSLIVNLPKWSTGSPKQRDEWRPSGESFIEAQLRLIEASRSGLPRQQMASLRKLVQLFETHRYPNDAMAYRSQLFERFGKIPAEDQDASAPSETEEGSAPRLPSSRAGRIDPWGPEDPKVTEVDAQDRELDFVALPVNTDRGALFDRISVSIDEQGSQLRFQGDEFHTAWQVALPETRSSFRALAPLCKGWGIGHLLILRLGSELLACTVLNDRGEPEAKVLWHLNIAAGAENRWDRNELEYQVARIGFGPDRLTISDAFLWPTGEVGPVRPGYLCYRRQGNFIAIDPLTGSELWRRAIISRDAMITGDDENIFVLSTRNRPVTVLRAVDGMRIGSRDGIPAGCDLLQLSEGKALVETREKRRSLKQIELLTGRTLWERSLAESAIPFAMEGYLTGLIESDGRVTFIRTETGLESGTMLVTVPNRLAAVHVGSDDRRFYLAFSEPVVPPVGQRWNADRLELRSPTVDGTLVAVDRQTLQRLWARPLRYASFLLDVPPEVPFLVLSSRRYRAVEGDENRSFPELLTTCLDKQTGREIVVNQQSSLSRGGFPTIETRPDDKVIEIGLPSKTLRLQYPR
ncbi:MAG: PQQ-binding-like beta-propeller repeat protein [Planctomycetaceae bacterium]